jgi:hypothetical protein
MKRFMLVCLLVCASIGMAQPSKFAADIMTGVTKFNLQEIQDSEVLTGAGAGIGVLYRFLKSDGSYDVAFGTHFFTGYADRELKFTWVAGASFLDGWLRVEPGYDFVSKVGVIMFSTSYGFTFPGTL